MGGRKGRDGSLRARGAPRAGEARRGQVDCEPITSLPAAHGAHPRLSRTPRPRSHWTPGGKNLPEDSNFQTTAVSSRGGEPLLRGQEFAKTSCTLSCSETPVYVSSSAAENTCLCLLWEGTRRSRKSAVTGAAAVPNVQNLLMSPSAC